MELKHIRELGEDTTDPRPLTYCGIRVDKEAIFFDTLDYLMTGAPYEGLCCKCLSVEFAWHHHYAQIHAGWLNNMRNLFNLPNDYVGDDPIV